MLPRILVLDDLFGRLVGNHRNVDREGLCATFLWRDATSDEATEASKQRVLRPTADVTFYRGQTPQSATIGDLVENDLSGSLAMVRDAWTGAIAAGGAPWAMVLLDLCFYTGRVTEDSHRRTPGMPEGKPGDDDPQSYFGLTLLDAIHREFPELPVFILSSKPRAEVSLAFARRGALGFIDRIDTRAPELLEEALWQHGLLPDVGGEIVGNSVSLLLALRETRRTARHRENVLIRGERGSGKELLASYIQRSAETMPPGGSALEPTGPFVGVNASAFPPNLFASELFGIEPRTATGVDGKIGLIEAADGGNLFLDEIGDLPPEVQAALLRVLQERTVSRVGSREVKDVDVRFISATNVDLEDSKRGFRPDLLDRLRAGGTIWLPPLRERTEDIPLFVESFVRQAEAQREGTRRREVVPEALDVLVRHPWPGNVRELRTVIFDAVSRHSDVEHLVPGHLRFQGATGKRPASRGTEDASIPMTTEPAIAGTPSQVPDVSDATMDDLVSVLDQCHFSPQVARRCPGGLAEYQRACTWSLARCLEAYLEAFRDPATEEIQYQVAVRKAMDDDRITGAHAADLIKRLLKPIAGELSGTLQDAHSRAVTLRGRKPAGASRDRNQEGEEERHSDPKS